MSTKGHAALRYVGTNAERVALATGPLITGTIWIETDTLDIYLWDGTAWVEVALDADGLYLRLDATNDPVTAGLEVNAATAVEPVLIVQTTDDDDTENLQEWQDSGGNILAQVSANGSLMIQTVDASDPTLILKTTNTPNQINIVLNESAVADVLEIRGRTASVDTNVEIIARDGENAIIELFSGVNNSVIQHTSADNMVFRNSSADKDILFQINDSDGGGAASTVLLLDGSEGNVLIPASTATAVPLIVKGAAAQSANLLELQESRP